MDRQAARFIPGLPLRLACWVFGVLLLPGLLALCSGRAGAQTPVPTDTATPTPSASVQVITFGLDNGTPYHVATVATYTDGERAMVALLILILAVDVVRFFDERTGAYWK